MGQMDSNKDDEKEISQEEATSMIRDSIEKSKKTEESETEDESQKDDSKVEDSEAEETSSKEEGDDAVEETETSAEEGSNDSEEYSNETETSESEENPKDDINERISRLEQSMHQGNGPQAPVELPEDQGPKYMEDDEISQKLQNGEITESDAIYHRARRDAARDFETKTKREKQKNLRKDYWNQATGKWPELKNKNSDHYKLASLIYVQEAPSLQTLPDGEFIAAELAHGRLSGRRIKEARNQGRVQAEERRRIIKGAKVSSPKPGSAKVPVLSDEERRVAERFGMSPKDYKETYGSGYKTSGQKPKG